MKRYFAILFSAMLILFLFSCSKESTDKSTSAVTTTTTKSTTATTATTASQKLEITSSAIINEQISDEYGKRGTQVVNNIPTRSIPLNVLSAPEGTVCYAITIIDPDSKALCGYEWVHWLATNITDKKIPANASIDLKDTIVQGKNSFGTIGYGGPTPPDKTHSYVITVYALDSSLELSNGYSLDDFNAAAKGHILDSTEIIGKYAK